MDRAVHVDLVDHVHRVDPVHRVDHVALAARHHVARCVIPAVALCAILAALRFAIRVLAYLKVTADHVEPRRRIACLVVSSFMELHMQVNSSINHPSIPDDPCTPSIPPPCGDMCAPYPTCGPC